MLLVAACHTIGEPVPPTVQKGWKFMEHPAIAQLTKDQERVWSFFRGVIWWLPLSDSFLFQAPLPNNNQARISTLGGLRKELEQINRLAWQADEETILHWSETEGYPTDGIIGADGKISMANIPERTEFSTDSLAKFAFSMFWAGNENSPKNNRCLSCSITEGLPPGQLSDERKIVPQTAALFFWLPSPLFYPNSFFFSRIV